MLPDFPNIKAKLLRELLRWFNREVSNLSPLLHDVRSYRQHEGKTSRRERPDGSTEETQFQQATGMFILDRDDMKKFDIESLKVKFSKIAKEIADTKEAMVLNAFSSAAASVGNVVSLGRELQPEDILELLRKIRLEFDPQTGEPKLPTLVLHPDHVERLREKEAEWSANQELDNERERIIAEKKKEWNARESLRKLVD